MKKNIGSSGQAALEFLSTYGFAFLIILVMIGALSYFGVLNPQGFIPSRCQFSPELSCSETQFTGGSTTLALNIVLVNQLGDQLSFNTAGSGNMINSQYGSGNCTLPIVFSGGAKQTIACNFVAGAAGTYPVKGQKVKATFDTSYNISGKVYPVDIHGEILNSIS